VTKSTVVQGVAWAVAVVAGAAFAQNPILPSWEYIPDGEPRIFGDRVYLYGSHDRAHSTKFCDYLLTVWSAPLNDLANWREEGHSFHTRPCELGHPSDVDWSTNELYAPDVVEKDGKYWLFAYIVGAPGCVAVSDSPGGPFKLVSKIRAPEGSPKDFGGWGQYIDPGVLVDDDGKVYIYWGYKRSHMAQLNPANMFEVLPNTYQPDIIPVDKPFNFFEAASPRKVGDTYYLIYADGGTLVYATSKKPTGPFEYGGRIITNGRDYPGGNNHGSICKINDQWYIFYHRMTNNTIFSRRACVERITIAPDGKIKEVEMTSLGFAESLDPYRRWSADIACVLKGGNYITEVDRETHPVILNRNSATIGFKYFEFGSKPQRMSFSIDVKLRAGAGRIDVWTGVAKTGTLIGSVEVPATLSTEDWTSVTCDVRAVEGRHAVYFTFSGDGEFNCDIRSFAFGRE
jgi:hypothetical protein